MDFEAIGLTSQIDQSRVSLGVVDTKLVTPRARGASNDVR